MSGVTPVRHLGPLRLLAVGINSVIGGGIFILPASVAGLIGPASLWAYLVAGAVVVTIGLSLSMLAARFEESGGPYLYVRREFGAFFGFQAGWLFCLARLTASASLLNGFARYLGALVPWGTAAPARILLVGLCAAALAAVNAAGIRQTAGAASALAVLKVVPLVLLGAAGLFFAAGPGGQAALPFAPADGLRAVLLLLFAFTGFEILTVPAEESLRPRRDIPFALVATILSVCGIYLLVHAAALRLLPGLAAETAPLATAAGVLAGPAGRYGMTAAAALSTAGCTLISMVGGTRILYAMSSGRQIPPWIGALHPGTRTPVTATILFGALAAGLAFWGRYEWLSAVSAGARLLVYLACCGACLRRPAGGGFGGRPVAGLAALAIVALLMALEPGEAVAGIIGIGVGLALYLAARRGRAAIGAEGESR